ncbi:MAG: hypothetical protein QOF14_1666 [Hyphomicrobiales bacterium]|jgi:hypothetical protein|nr:hypothetical protein [Hyphomicrobiales bacterium]
MSRFVRIAGTIALLLAAAPMAAAQEQTVRVRGTIERVEDDTYIVKARSGGEVKVKLPDNVMVVALTKASLADIKQGSYVGVAGMPQADGRQKALEVHIFPEAMRGTGDGHRGWDLQPSSTMTNGAVEQTAASADGQVLTLKYKDGEKKIVVSPDTPIVVYVPGEKSELKAGAPIFISAATKTPDGTLTTPRVNVGRGVAPPM